MPRPKKYADAAARTAAYRDKLDRVDLTMKKETVENLRSIADELGISLNALCVSMIKFALTNHNWRVMGVLHGKKK